MCCGQGEIVAAVQTVVGQCHSAEMALPLNLEGHIGFGWGRRAFQMKTVMRKKNEFIFVWHSKGTDLSRVEGVDALEDYL